MGQALFWPNSLRVKPGWKQFATADVPDKRFANSSVNKTFANFESA